MTNRIQLHTGYWPHTQPSIHRLEDVASVDSSSVEVVEIVSQPNCDVAAVTVSDRRRRLETDPRRSALLAKARSELADSALMAEVHPFKKMRLKAGLSQEKLAALANTSQAQIAKLEKTNSDPHVSTICRMAQAMNVSPVEVFECFSLGKVAQ